MIVTIFLGLISILFNFISYFQKKNWGLKLSFFFIFLFLGLRYNFGNDYITYLELFKTVKENPDVAFDEKMYIFYEPGWMILNWLCRPIGFFGMTILLAFFYSFTIYTLIKNYVPYRYYWLAVFFVVFNSGFLLVHSTAMRQTVAILIFLWSIDFIINKKIIKFIFCIALASTFHYTSITVLLISPFLFDNRKIRIFYGSILFSIYLFIFIFGSYLTQYVGILASIFSERYEAYSDKGNANSGLGFIFYALIFLLTLSLDKFQDKKTALFFKLAIVYFMLMPFKLIIEMTARIGMYFSPSEVIMYPFMLKTIKINIYKYSLLFILILFTIYQFFQFFFSDTYKSYFMEYHTFLSADQWI